MWTEVVASPPGFGSRAGGGKCATLVNPKEDAQQAEKPVAGNEHQAKRGKPNHEQNDQDVE
jgi:hypothetical protein